MFSNYLKAFDQYAPLKQRVLHVLRALPQLVQNDFLTDPCFTVSLDNFVPGAGSTVFMASPEGADDHSRSVVLRPRLSECHEEFAHYVIAHEFAHAFLRNGPWGEITDIEDAANALAASWGFPRPTNPSAIAPWLNRM